MLRREFLQLSGLATASLALPSWAPSVATMQVGYAAITWGGNDPAAIDDVSAAGYAGIQLRASAVKRWEQTPEVLRALLAEKRLAFPVLSSGGVPFADAAARDSFAMHVANARFAKAAGGRYLQVVDERPRGGTPEAPDYARMGRLLTELGTRVADEGITLVYHNHMGALGEHPTEVARILDATDAKAVQVLLDTAHWQAAGGNPVEAVKQYAPRIAVVHLKDLEQPLPNGSATSYRFRELGAGRVPIPQVIEALNKIGFAGWGIVELDGVPVPNTAPKLYAEQSKRYLESLGVRVSTR
jgi:inosose dehydratase